MGNTLIFLFVAALMIAVHVGVFAGAYYFFGWPGLAVAFAVSVVGGLGRK